jgi:hypothetical protein
LTRRAPSRRSRSTTWRVLALIRLTLADAWDEIHASRPNREHCRSIVRMREPGSGGPVPAMRSSLTQGGTGGRSPLRGAGFTRRNPDAIVGLDRRRDRMRGKAAAASPAVANAKALVGSTARLRPDTSALDSCARQSSRSGSRTRSSLVRLLLVLQGNDLLRRIGPTLMYRSHEPDASGGETRPHLAETSPRARPEAG